MDILPHVDTGRTDANIARFVARTRPFADVWGQADVRYAALKKGDVWYNVFCEVRFAALDEVQGTSETFVDLPSFVAGRIWFPGPNIEALAAQLDERWLEVGPHRIRLAGPPIGGANASESSYGWSVHSPALVGESSLFWSPGWDTPGFVLHGGGSALTYMADSHEWEDLEDRLGAATPTYFGIDDLLTYHLMARMPATAMNSATRFCVSAPLYTRVEVAPGELDREFRVNLEAPPSVPSSDFRVTYRLLQGGRPIRRDFQIGSDSMSTIGPGHYRQTLHFPEGEWVDIQVLFRHRRVGGFQFALQLGKSGNPRSDAIMGLAQARARLSALLSGDQELMRLGNSFEIGTLWVLEACGFHVLPLNLKGTIHEDETVDLLAFVTGSRNAFAVEVTGDHALDKNKLADLHYNSTRLRKLLPDIELHPVIVTGHTSVTNPELTAAAEFGIRILTLTDLNGLWDIAKTPNPLHQASTYILSKPNQLPPTQV